MQQKVTDEIVLYNLHDMHVHLRRGLMMVNVLLFTIKIFARAVVMGNLNREQGGPIVTANQVVGYRDEIMREVDRAHCEFEPIMTVMLVRGMTPAILRAAHKAGARVLKWIPGGASSNSEEGVPMWELKKYYPVLKEAEQLGMIFSGHWELSHDFETGLEIPEILREKMAMLYFLELLEDAQKYFPGLRIIAEHLTTAKGIQIVKAAPVTVAGTFTAHHPFLIHKQVFNKKGNVSNPDLYCKPCAKGEIDQQAIIAEMTSGDPSFFFGSDSAPWPRDKKKGPTPAAGICTSPTAIQLLCSVFEKAGKLDRLSDFVSVFGPRFYGLPPVPKKITLMRRSWTPAKYQGDVRIFQGGEILDWRVANGNGLPHV